MPLNCASRVIEVRTYAPSAPKPGAALPPLFDTRVFVLSNCTACEAWWKCLLAKLSGICLGPYHYCETLFRNCKKGS